MNARVVPQPPNEERRLSTVQGGETQQPQPLEQKVERKAESTGIQEGGDRRDEVQGSPC